LSRVAINGYQPAFSGASSRETNHGFAMTVRSYLYTLVETSEEVVMRHSARFVFAAMIAVSATSAKAQSGVEVGMLECRGLSNAYVLASVTDLGCVYRPSVGGRSHSYIARIHRIGLDIGVNQSTVLAWAVYAPTRSLGRGSLAGNYFGASANATVGVGVGANALFGGSDNTISLQPVSVQGQTGIGVAGGVSALYLRPRGRR
jgi:hypothetical protein